ncbi:hypothetical protein K788_0000400 [Paraburkholderia caribensis MBA4]|uniref:Uncharacterized protein n=1 Tax=Paraburkholderia caribensis MBA4 TaxID=1323664 RepID=A0A0P0RIQ2_9BURK|nr:hypothetical protein K788_0000400 [Paraburkholderia caribensis MBA4]
MGNFGLSSIERLVSKRTATPACNIFKSFRGTCHNIRELVLDARAVVSR